jgi:hypothetical protein
MPQGPEDIAREQIDRMLEQAGWAVQDVLKDESIEASDNLPDPDVIAQEIVEDLEAALEQFREIASDLGARGAAAKTED